MDSDSTERLRESLKDKLPEADLDALLDNFYGINNVVETRGGGPLLGVNGVSVVGHGSARADAVERAIGIAKLAVDTDFIPQDESAVGGAGIEA